MFLFFFDKRSFRYENDDEKSKAKRSFFQKFRFFKNGRFYKIVVSLTIVNYDPSLPIVNEERIPT